MELALKIINAFVLNEPEIQAFSGNPAAVCVLSHEIDAALMQNIASQNNLSETAFVAPQENHHQLRWFTPAVEVDLCGHATLASAAVLFDEHTQNENELVFETRSGQLKAQRVDDKIQLDFPAQPAHAFQDEGQRQQVLKIITAACGCTPKEVLLADDVVAIFDELSAITEMTPDQERLRLLPGRGLVVTSTDKANERYGCDFVSRWFGPHVGVAEDPFTGSAHCTLAPLWQQRLGRSMLTARQLSARGGWAQCEVTDDRVRLLGRTQLYLEGRIFC